MKGKKGGLIGLIIGVIIIVVVFAVIAYRAPKSVDETTELTELEELTTKNLEASYPATPREVVKLYNRYLLLLYGDTGYSISKDELKQLGSKMRMLYDEELLGVNPEATYYSSLEADIMEDQLAGKVMLQTNVADSADVENLTIDGRKCATLSASYFTKRNNADFTKTYQQYLLRKDANGKWKILGFQQFYNDQK